MADVSATFVTQYEAEVHMAYQQGGSHLRNTVRVKSGVVGSSDKFGKIGKGEATKKDRHADVDPMDVDHGQVEALLEDWYAPAYVDKLDELKIKHDERKALVDTGAWAIGRKVDSLIVAAATEGVPAENVVGTGAAFLTLDNCLEAFALLNEREVPDDGNRFAVVGPRQWNQLLKIDQFAKSDFIGNALPWLKGREAKRWLNIVWMMHTGLAREPAGDAPTSTRCLLYHKTALGLAEGTSGIQSEINYVPQKVAFLCNNMISAGAVAIDPEGLVCLWAKDK